MHTEMNDLLQVNQTNQFTQIQVYINRTREEEEEEEENEKEETLRDEKMYLLVRQSNILINETDEKYLVIDQSALNLNENEICQMNKTPSSICSIQCSDQQPWDFILRNRVKTKIKKSSKTKMFSNFISSR